MQRVFRWNRARERLERREGARASAANARARPVRATRDAPTPTIALLAAPNLSRGPRRADYGELCAPSARGCHDIFFVFSIWRAETTPLRRARASPPPPRRDRRAFDRTIGIESRRDRSRNAPRTRADRTPRPHPTLSSGAAPFVPQNVARVSSCFFASRFFQPTAPSDRQSHQSQSRRTEQSRGASASR